MTNAQKAYYYVRCINYYQREKASCTFIIEAFLNGKRDITIDADWQYERDIIELRDAVKSLHALAERVRVYKENLALIGMVPSTDTIAIGNVTYEVYETKPILAMLTQEEKEEVEEHIHF